MGRHLGQCIKLGRNPKEPCFHVVVRLPLRKLAATLRLPAVVVDAVTTHRSSCLECDRLLVLSTNADITNRLSGHPVHADTLGHWTDFLQHARRQVAEGSNAQTLALTVELEQELAERAG